MLPSNVNLVMKKSFIDGLSILKGFITMLSIHDGGVYIENNPESIVGNYDTVLDNKFIYSPSEHPMVEFFYTCRIMVLKSEEPEQKNLESDYNFACYSDNGAGNNNLKFLFSTDTFIDWNPFPELICDKIKNRVFASLDKIIIKNIVIQNVERIISNYIPGETMAISVRTWKSAHETNINRPYSFDMYKDKIEVTLKNNQNIKTIIISLDNDSVKEDYVKFFKTQDYKIIFLENNNNLNFLQFSMVKMLAMSKCDHLIGNRISNYTDLIFWFSRCKIKVTTVG
jgi:hypothetical protein